MKNERCAKQGDVWTVMSPPPTLFYCLLTSEEKVLLSKLHLQCPLDKIASFYDTHLHALSFLPISCYALPSISTFRLFLMSLSKLSSSALLFFRRDRLFASVSLLSCDGRGGRTAADLCLFLGDGCEGCG